MFRPSTCKSILLALFVIQNFLAQSQDIFTYNYRSTDGLDTDIIKCISQDSLGFIWIGADDGLFRFDGINFTRYAEGAPSNFFKYFLNTSDGRLLGVHDMGITVINPDVNQPTFDVLLAGNRTLTDSALWYPKHAYEDHKGYLWIAEPQSIVRYKDGQWKRYHFGPLDNTISFVRSFNFFETADKRLIVISNSGNYYHFNESDETFQALETNKSVITYDIKRIDDITLLATGSGIMKVEITQSQVMITPTQMSGTDSEMEYRHIQQLSPGRFVISGINDNTSIVNLDDFSAQKVVNSDMFVNQSFVDAEGNIWLSTQKGIQLLTLPEFRKTQLDKPNNYLEALITSNETPYIYALRSTSIWQIDKSTEKGKEILIGDKNDYFLSGVYIDQHLFVSSGYRLLKIKGDQIADELDLMSQGRYIFDVVYDSHSEAIWISQESFKGVRKVNPKDLSYESYSLEKGLTTEISGIKVTDKGVYALSSNPDHYLYFKPHDADEFIDLSIRFEDPYRIGLSVDDIAKIDEVFLLATNYGLFALQESSVDKLEINLNFDNSAVRALLMEDKHLWIATTSGLIRYNLVNHDYAQYSETSGLPVNTVNKECLIINDNKLWVGTSQGVAVTDYQPNSTPKQPLVLSIIANGKVLTNTPQIEVPYESFMTINISSLLFPANDVEYSYKLNDRWSAPNSSPAINLSELRDGKYDLKVRAKKVGNFGWSDPTLISFKVNPPFYKTVPFFLAVMLVLGVVVFATRYMTSRREKQRQLLLTMLVDERTQELNKMKDQLEVMVRERTEELQKTVTQLQETQNQLIHAEKMASLGVLTAGIAHEINNPVNYLQGGLYSLESILHDPNSAKSKQELDEVIELMKLGITRITTIVKGLSRYSREGDHSMQPCNIHEVIHSCLIIMEHELKERIQVNLQLLADEYAILGDEGNLHQLLINLISNAAQAITNEGTITITTEIENNQLLLTVSDTGSGIDEKVLDKVFDPFFTTKAPGIGTGLGLFISKKIVTEHQGQIHFQSKKGKGTTVLVTFNLLPNGSIVEKEGSIRG